MEHALDPVYAARCGVDVDELYISQPDTGEQALEIAEALVRCGPMDVVVVDSVAALVPRAEIEGEMGDAHLGLQARLMSQALRKLSGAIKQTNTAMIFTNQLRQKIGVMFGNPETTTGGMALEVLRLGAAGHAAHPGHQGGRGGDRQPDAGAGEEEQGGAAVPGCEFDIMYNEGISRTGDVLDLAVEYGIVEKRGAPSAMVRRCSGRAERTPRCSWPRIWKCWMSWNISLDVK